MQGLPRLVLIIGGVLMVIAGSAGIVLGATSGPFLRSLLPRVVVDAAAVGGAAVALSSVIVAVGVLQLALARAVSSRSRWPIAAAVILTAFLAAIGVAIAVVSVTEAAVAHTAVMLAVGAAALVIALAYAAASVQLAAKST
jgi:hypothetical protein